ncbi:MAG: sulfatase [Bacteroidetes bacterium]|nr:sulfatase [Bacteroidota bacterium]
MHLRYLLNFILILTVIGCKPRSANRLPNIVLIFTDDQGYGDLGTYGAIGYTTPHLDKLAAEGIRFTNFYSAQAVCSASRAGLLTGCYPNRINIHGALMPWSKNGLHDNEITIAEMLKQKGYATGIFGKWHLGHQKKFLPLQHGFDEYFGLPYSNDMWPVNFDGTPITDSTSWKARYPILPLIDGNEKVGEIKTLKDQATLTTRYTERAIQFIEKNKNRPFFLYFPHSMPHVPLGVSEKFSGKSRQGMYGDVIMEIDWSVGQVLQALEENGLSENTFVIYTSDNGPWLNFGNHAGSTGGLREGKGTSFEGGQRVPCIIRWPGRTVAGKVISNLASTIDILPTIAAITGAALPDHKIDGVNILPLVLGEPEADPRDHLYYYYGVNNLEAVLKDNWKLIFPHKHRSYIGHAPGNDGWPGKTHQDSVGLELYDLRRDPGERYDVKEMYPEIVASLQQIGMKAREDLGDELTGKKGKNRRECGWIE